MMEREVPSVTARAPADALLKRESAIEATEEEKGTRDPLHSQISEFSAASWGARVKLLFFTVVTLCGPSLSVLKVNECLSASSWESFVKWIKRDSAWGKV